MPDGPPDCNMHPFYRTLKNTLPEDVLHEIIRGAVDVEPQCDND